MSNDEIRIKIKIDSNSQELVLMKQQVQDLGNSFNKTDSMAATFISRLELIGGVAGGLYIINKTIGDIGRTGFETNRTFQKLTNSLATSIAITSANVDSLGNQITLSQKYAIATDEARFSLEQLNKINSDTPHVLDQTVKIYDAMYIGMKKVGAQSEDIVDITKKLSIAVGDKVGFDAMLSAMDGFTGTVEVSSEMGRFLKSIGLSNEAIKNSTDVVQLFKDKLSGVKAIESFDTKLSNLTESYNKLSKAITEPAFNTIEDNLKPASEILDSLSENLPTITNVAGEIVQVGISIGATTLAMKGYTTATKIATATNILFGGSFGAVNRNILMTSLAVGTFNRILKASPFGLAAMAIYGISESFSEASNRADIFKKSLTEVSSELDIIRYKERLQEVNQELKKMDKNIAGYNDNQKLMYQGGYELAYKEKQKLEKLIAESSPTKKGKTVYELDTTEIDKLVNDTLNPYGSKLDEINKKWQPNFENLQRNGKDTSKLYQAWSKEIADLDKEEADKKEKALKENQKLFEEQEKSAEQLNKAYSEISQIGMSEYDKGLISITEKTNEWKKAGVSQNDILIAQSKLLDELKSKTLYEAQKEDLSYYERKIQLMDDSIGKETELQGIAYTNKILEIENSTKSIAEKDKLIAKETELFNLTVQHMTYKDNLEFQNTMSNFYDDMLDSQLALNNAVYDFGSGFDGVSSKIGAVSKSIAAMSSLELTNKKEASKLDKKYIEQFNKYAGDVEKTKALEQQYTKDTAILNEQNIQAQLAGYSNIAGAMSGMFEQGSREAASFQLVESGLALATGIRAILTQGSGDPYTAFARMAAMTATVSSMLGNIGIAFDMNKTSTSSDAFSAMTANNGSGSVLGDSEDSTKSITNALSTLEDFAKPEYQTLLSMNNYLETIANNIGGVTSLLIQSGGFAFGEGYSGFDTGYKNKISGGLASLNLFDALTGTKIMGGIMNSVLGGLFGKTKVSQSLTDSGIYFADQLLTSAIKEFNGQAYQTISTTTSKKSWFSSSSSTSINSYFDELDGETERQFSLVLDNLYNTVLFAGTALDSASIDTARSLQSFIVNIGKISLNGKTGDQIQETLTSIFGEIGDDIAKTAFPLLTPFQQIGEGMFETLTRVATGMEEAEYYIGRLGNKFADVIYTSIGNKQGDVGLEALLQSIKNVEDASYGVAKSISMSIPFMKEKIKLEYIESGNLYKIIESLSGTAEELYGVYIALDELRDKLIYIGQSAQGISSSMIYGAGSADALAEGFNSFFENFLSENEQLTYKTQQLIENFNDLGIALPVSKDSFKALLSGLDLTSSAGQELYGRLIVLSESFAEVADSTSSSIEDLTTSLTELSTNSFDTFISSLDSVGQSITSIKQTALGFINGFTNSSSASLKDQLISYNKLREQFSSYFDSDGIIKAGVNQNDVSGLYSQITSLASNISGKDNYLKDSLISQISSDLVKFNSAEDILKVNIVDGLGSLLGLNNQQLTQLQTVASDGKITNTELSTINGLTKTQKDGIVEFASNSLYFSTEDTLSNLATYSKLQLEAYQKAQAEEVVGLSRQTLTYGDYIGTQEKIDIAKTLGVSYDTAKPLISSLQNLSISTNPTANIKSMLGYSKNATSYDNTMAAQLSKLSPYIGSVDVASIIGEVDSTTKANTAYKTQLLADIATKTALLGNMNSVISAEDKNNYYTSQTGEAWTHFGDNKGMAELAASLFGTKSSSYKGYSTWTGSGGTDYDIPLTTAAMEAKRDAIAQAIAGLVSIKNAKGFATGGYTGDIPVNAIAGFVHGKEHVLDSNITSQINSIGSVTDMVNQYTNTNFYEKMNSTFIDMKNEIKNLLDITVKQAREIQKLNGSFEDFNTRDLIKTAKGA